MRGKALVLLAMLLPLGITPACAGKSKSSYFSCFPVRDHPRVCGEKAAAAAPAHNQSGSPPRVRGKGVMHQVFFAFFGITPACAGKSYHAWHMVVIVWDHPRVCGEKHLGSIIRVCLVGSPPRVRGKERCGRASRMSKGITPACAGKSHIPNTRVTTTWDHPRVCGEKNLQLEQNNIRRGSPPRVRGKVSVCFCCSCSLRITPACAGKRNKANARLTAGQDHPRVCGEKTMRRT